MATTASGSVFLLLLLAAGDGRVISNRTSSTGLVSDGVHDHPNEIKPPQPAHLFHAGDDQVRQQQVRFFKSGTQKREDNWVISLFVVLHIGPFLHRLGFETDRFRTITPARERDHHEPCKGACQSRSLTAMHREYKDHARKNKEGRSRDFGGGERKGKLTQRVSVSGRFLEESSKIFFL
uniref:Secreted protein n=1 Tax=Vitis vinifera TaxID=29760 RepID=A5AGK0_VITVI|nr:hypothetical protein VITISV_022525 [Vitis vinifera]